MLMRRWRRRKENRHRSRVWLLEEAAAAAVVERRRRRARNELALGREEMDGGLACFLMDVNLVMEVGLSGKEKKYVE